MKRRAVGALLLGIATQAPAAVAPDFDASRASVAELQQAQAAGRVTSARLVAGAVLRIEALDRHGPRLNAVIELNPDAAAIAAALDAERAQRGPRSPLHGIPVLIKDNIDTADAMLTTAGSLALLGTRPTADAAIVKRLREAGAVILGKTNLSEWANLRSPHSSSGWSARGGQTRNPFDPTRSPCGSSSGSGSAVAAGYVVLAVGTETDGSITCPSSVAGLVGLKPTIGLVSRSGIVPISISQDTAGPMARSVADAAALLQALAGADAGDAATGAAPQVIPDYSAALSRDALRGRRIGVARDLAGFSPAVDALFERALARLRAAGAELVDAPLKLPKQIDDDELAVLLTEFKDGIGRYLASRPPQPGAPRTLLDLIAFNRAQSALELPTFGQELFEQAQEKPPLTDAGYRRIRARALKAAGADGIDALLRRQRLDAYVAPTTGVAWKIDAIAGDHYTGGSAASAPAVAGYPHLSLPMGMVHGLPVGLSIIGPAFSEARLLGFGYAFEQAGPALVVAPSLAEPADAELDR